jgi:hypothetical protein
LQSEKIATVVKAAGIKVEAYWPALFAKLLQSRSVDDLILSVGSGIPSSSRSYCSIHVLSWFFVPIDVSLLSRFGTLGTS